MGTKTRKQLFISIIIVALLVVIDQITKHLAVLFLKDQPAIPIIKDVFELQYHENTSAAFGIDPISLLHRIFQFDLFNNNPELYLNTRMGFFYILTITVIVLLCFVFIRIPNEKRFVYMDYVLIFFTAGALGNFIDRIFKQCVVDFLYFKLIDFPIFNVADIYVTCSTFVMFALGIFYYNDDDIDKIFPKKQKNRE